ncbi:unnamed protein product, partial [Rotaria magnacalcarata]
MANLFPQIESLKIGVVLKEILNIIRYLLTEMFHLSFLCIKQIPKLCLREMNLFVQSGKLRENYSIKLIDHDLYLW